MIIEFIAATTVTARPGKLRYTHMEAISAKRPSAIRVWGTIFGEMLGTKTCPDIF